MKLFKSNEPNTFHYVTLVTHHRVPVFRSELACEIFVDVLSAVREKFPYKLIGYVLMPDHVHAIVNNRKWHHKRLAAPRSGKLGQEDPRLVARGETSDVP